jgi:hypothetical protein
VDDIDTACISNGSVLSLSGAMPGLAGATLRRGGQLASFRGSISCRSDGKSVSSQTGHVVVKLFNLLVKDLGPMFLKQGILVTKKQLEDFLGNQSEKFWQSLTSAHLDSQEISRDTWSQFTFPDVLLVTVEPIDRS